jgi:hypothetical protein
MERIKKKMVTPTKTSSALNHMITLYNEYNRNCDKEPHKQDRWNKWFLQAAFEYLNEYGYLNRSSV